MPDIEGSRKTAEKGAGWVTVKQPKNSRKNTRNTRKTVKTAVFRVFRVFFRLFFGCFTVTHTAPFSAVFRMLSMSGIWHLCRWPQRLQPILSHLEARNFKLTFRVPWWQPPFCDGIRPSGGRWGEDSKLVVQCSTTVPSATREWHGGTGSLYHLPRKHYPINSENFKPGNGDEK